MNIGALRKLLDLMIDEAEKDREDANARGFSIDDRRALANTVTKLKEARMWNQQAAEYYARR